MRILVRHHLTSDFRGSLYLAFTLLLTALFTTVNAYGASVPTITNQSQTDAATRPRIGLVLSGGGARGYAHLGVLKVLEELHIPIDYIAATSMGAVVGGLYASGLSADALEKKLTDINLSDIAFDRNDRAKLPQSRREDNFQYPIGLSAGYGDGKLKLATGLVQGNHLLTLLQNWTAQLPANITFDQLPTPFRAVATDLGSGEEVVLTKGSLPRAIRASMAVPGLFAPFQIDGHTLVDGGLVSNLPVQLARDMGSDIIIAVNIATPLQDPENIDSPTAVAQQMVTILIRQNVKAQKALLNKNDVLIEPELGNLSFTDFSRGKDGINAGREATERLRPKLMPLALPEAQWAAYLAARHKGNTSINILTADTRIDAIEITTKGPVPATVVQRQLDVREGDRYDVSNINQELARLTTNGDFKSVTQEMGVKDDRTVLKIDAEAKTWGPQFLLFGFGVSNSFDAGGGFNLQIGHRFPWLTQSGLEWRNDIVLGDKQVNWHTELRQPIWNTLGVYLAPYAEYSRRRVDIYSDEGPNADTVPTTSYVITSATAGVDLGMPIGRLGEFRAGVNYRELSGHPFYNFLNIFQSQRIRQATARAQVTIDQLDDALFPRKGYYLSAVTNVAFGGAENRYNDAQIKALWAISTGRHTVNFALEGASVYGNNNNDSIGSGGLGFTLGGFQHLSAYAPDQFTGNYLLYGRVTYLNNLQKIRLPGLSNPVFGTSLEMGDVWQTRDNVNKGPYKKSISMFLGGNSLIGPVYFGLAVAPQGVWNLYLQLGRVF
ncbi:patatin-like phospholipase family protein [Glaciimonas sp. GG7]